MILSFVIFVATKKTRQYIFSPALVLLLLDPGSGMDKNQDLVKHPGSATLGTVLL
jgi:hypothetical protein